MHRVVIIDTSIMCCWLAVPGKETCGSGKNEIDQQQVQRIIDDEIKVGSTLVLPLATIIETGNHIAHSPSRRYEIANKLKDLIYKTAEAETPWAAFTAQNDLWNENEIKELSETWTKEVVRKVSLADISIRKVAEYYSLQGINVYLFTGDGHLKEYITNVPRVIPRRKQRRQL